MSKITRTHEPSEFFEYVRLDGDRAIPPASPECVDVAVLDMNHSWPNLGHDALVHAVRDAAELNRDSLNDAGLKVRVLSYDVRRCLLLPEAPGERFQLYIGTGGPGHLDPRMNDGHSEASQGIDESPEWEGPLFRLFDAILSSESAALLAVCHSFGLLCRWSGAAHAVLRGADKNGKSSGMPLNVLTAEACEHPWFGQLARQLPDGAHHRVVDNRLFDLVVDPDVGGPFEPIAFELSADGTAPGDAVTMIEFARDASDTMPRVFGVNHHPEIIDREHITAVLEQKRANREVSSAWYRERRDTMQELFLGENERQSRLTSYYTLLGPLQFHLTKLVDARRAEVAPAKRRAG
ncbi:MAG TPA: hypothetical protein VEZ11_18085 [Thermoanaerobaculia bacterium]|nr:hypothetical protein [Thermoanaerobaculia bacterium]